MDSRKLQNIKKHFLKRKELNKKSYKKTGIIAVFLIIIFFSQTILFFSFSEVYPGNVVVLVISLFVSAVIGISAMQQETLKLVDEQFIKLIEESEKENAK